MPPRHVEKALALAVLALAYRFSSEHKQAMLAALTRLQAMAFIVAVTALAIWSLTIRPAADDTSTRGALYSDVRLYHDIGNAVARGEGYYRAAVRLHRAHGFPTSPFVTVRLPSLAWIEACLGWQGTRGLLAVLLGGCAVTWFVALRPVSGVPKGLAAMLLILAGGAMVGSDALLVWHELWAGILVSIAMALLMRGAWPAALVATACALAIRELAAPFALIAAFHAWRCGRRGELAAWLALLAGFAVALLLHRAAVVPLSLPGDVRSEGWDALRGPAAPLRDIVDVTLFNLLPVPLGYLAALLALVGFLGAPRPLARLALPWLGVLIVLLALFARAANFYWAILATPTLPAGFAFLPGVVRDLYAALRGPASPQT